MTSEYSVSVTDWENLDKWTNHGDRVARERCEHTSQERQRHKETKQPTGENEILETNMDYSGWCEECGYNEGSNQPMMSYAYPLRHQPSDDQVEQVIKQTCLTVMENEEDGGFFLALCGGGMDLSQSIALAYLLCGERIPDALAYNVCTQPMLSVSGKDYIRVMKGCEESLKIAMSSYGRKAKEIRRELKQYRQDVKRKKVNL